MAEFQEVMRHYNRMSEEERLNLYACFDPDIRKGEGMVGCKATITNGHLPCVARCSADHFEKMVMLWAEAHPEPRFPSWREWQKENFPDAEDDMCPKLFISSCEAKCIQYPDCNECLGQPIPERIAKKLGISEITCNHKSSNWDTITRIISDELKNIGDVRYTFKPGGELSD